MKTKRCVFGALIGVLPFLFGASPVKAEDTIALYSYPLPPGVYE
ncbi:exported hypothetical protein [Azospirillaceae bacterium]